MIRWNRLSNAALRIFMEALAWAIVAMGGALICCLLCGAWHMALRIVLAMIVGVAMTTRYANTFG
jgi:hypothetical protein